MQIVKSLTFGVVASALAFAISSILPGHAQSPSLILFTVAVVLTAWFHGRTSGLLAWAISLLAAVFLVVSHSPSHSLLNTAQFPRIINVFLISLAGVFVVARLRVALRYNAFLLSQERSARESRDSLISQLRASGERLRLMQKAARAWNWEVELTGGTFLLHRDPSSPTRALSHVTRFDDWVEARVHPDDRRSVRETLASSFQLHSPLDTQFRVRSAAGEYRWLHCRGSHVADRLLGVTMDITANKLAEENLRRSEQHFEALSRATFEGIAITKDWQLVDLNLQLSDMLGYAPEELIGTDVSTLIVPADRDRVRENADRNGGRIEHRLLRKDGSIITVEGRGKTVTFQDHTLRFTSIRDITEQKQAEEAIAKLNQGLRRRAAELETIFDTAPVGLAICEDVEGLSIRGNAANERLVGVSRGGQLSLAAPGAPQFTVLQENHQLTPPELPMQRAVRGEIVSGQTFDILRHDGTTVTVHASAAPLFDENGNPRGAIGAFADITALKRAEEALRQSREHLRAMAEALPHIVWSCDSAGTFDYVSPRWFDYTGLTPDQTFSPDGYLDRIHPDDRPRAEAEWKSTLAAGVENSAEVRLRSKTGEYRWHAVRAVPVRDRGNNVSRWFGTLTDIEEAKLAQATLIQNEKLASTGRMAATIAHEINNPLAAAMNSLYLISMDPCISPACRDLLQLADGELRHAAQITRQTLGFYREQGLPAAISVADTADAVLNIYQKRIHSKGVRVERRHRSAPDALAVEGEIRQVIANLIANALDASAAGDTIHLRTSAATDGVKITVADTGSGIPPHLLRRIFDAFFTTKENVGTGLGLWISRELISKQNGHIRVRSIQGKGTVFTITLPTAAAEPVLNKKAQTA